MNINSTLKFIKLDFNLLKFVCLQMTSMQPIILHHSESGAEIGDSVRVKQHVNSV